MFLDTDTFSNVIKHAPLVSIDLVIRNRQNQALLGQRLNRPAKNYWFVPGGRILKNESLDTAFRRLTIEELGKEFGIESASLLGPYDHFYDDNVFGELFTTHYVAIAYVLVIEEDLTTLPIDVQHGGYKWFDIGQLLNDDSVHSNTKAYFEQK